MRCAVYTRQSVKRAGDDPATASSSTASIGSYGSSPLSRLAAFFERHRVGLTIVAGHIDADAGSLAGLQVNMLATFAEWERELIRERIADTGGAIKARGERSAGRVPLGYRTDRLTKQLLIDERAAVAVRWFFDEATKGITTSDLVKKANRTELAAKNWSSRTVLRLLTNPTYAGRRPDGAPGDVAREGPRRRRDARRGRARDGDAHEVGGESARPRALTEAVPSPIAHLR